MAMAAAADAACGAAAVRAETEQIRSRRWREAGGAGDRGASARGPGRREAKANRRALEDAREDAEAAANIISGHSLRMEERKKKADAAPKRRVKLTMDVGRAGEPHPSADGDGEGLRGLLQGGQAGHVRPRAACGASTARWRV